MRYDVPPPERLQRNVLELLRRSDTYHVAYRAAFCYDARPALQRLRVPVLVTAADWDPLAAHLGRLPQAAPNLALRRAPSAAAAEFLAAEFLAPAAAAPPPLPVPASSGAGGRRLLLGDDYALHAFEWGAADGPQLVLLHDATARAAAVAPLGAALAARGMRVFAPDLPGHGESSSPGALAADVVERCARRLDDALSGRVRGPVALLGVGAGAHVALALAERWRSAVTQVVAHEPHAWPEEDRARIAAAMAVVPAPDWYGGHLQHAWHRSRDAALFHPWCSRRQASALSGEPQLDTAAAHERAVGLLLSGEAGPALAAAAARDDLASRLATAAPRACVSHDERLPSASVNALRAACAPSATRCTAVPAAADAAALADSLSRLLRRVA
jgi:pimeloyl-ACP methyl ester carboxylesterase